MELQLLAALLVGVAAVVAIIVWTRLDAFVGLLAGALVTGVIAGVPVTELIEHITTGFGNTLAGIGIVIALGVMIGKVLEESGGADALARMFLNMAGKGREDVAMTATGAVVSVPVFCDSGFVILHPLARSLARRYGKPLVTLSLALAGGLSITHHLVPPTPGPLAAVGLLGADLGTVILAGGLMSIVLIPVVVTYARIMGPRLEKQLDPDLVPEMAAAGSGSSGTGSGSASGSAGTDAEPTAPERPRVNPLVAAIPLLLPLLLIIGNTVSTAAAEGTAVAELFTFIGNPAIALLIGLAVAVYVLPRRGTPRKTVIGWLTAAAASAGMIVFITGAGGAFGEVLRQSGVGDALGEAVAGWPVPMFLMPFIIATFVRLAQGSGTVAMITAATLSAPVVQSAGVDPTVAVLSACAGSFVFSYVSDSYFWVVTRFTGLSGGAAVKMWSGMSTVLWAASLPLLGIAALILG
ncbi:GntP family permease [Streptomonospora nanhaiensis]|uniref:GntP family gluconate:H+ symporter n=1 Tax=Streptomonospora nanhaiensis TaxID=1323731 RepID=A0A853BGW2_9ACTN|nr:SLC13 family permease [Streptomonospora nanhaiensis]MBV2366626.1 GntP family permease [Streptomonospora nanhaiensis]MBX9391503.1 GntP family permease [Streptomonospora nanhaiensis]NYI93787.1 GntP family gluconate:H+ symporter [Streptomonospora nanhaiensis]